MANRSRQYGHYRRRRRRPALLGATAFASVIVLALGGILLVGLDTVGSQGRQLTRVAEPELAQASSPAQGEGAGGKTADKQTDKQDGKQTDKQDNKQNSDKQQASRPSKDSSGDKTLKEQASKPSGGKASDRASNAKDNQDKKTAKDSNKKNKQKDENKDKKKEPAGPPPPPIDKMWMSIPRLGMQSDTVYNSGSHETMGVGAIKLPPTGFPWQDNANTYISAHRIGYPGTQSDMQFYALPAMQQGDVVYVGDANGTTYVYKVTNKFAVKPWENWVTEPQGDDMLTLQTCVDSLDPSTWWNITPAVMRSGYDSARLIVQAEKVATYPAG